MTCITETNLTSYGAVCTALTNADRLARGPLSTQAPPSSTQGDSSQTSSHPAQCSLTEEERKTPHFDSPLRQQKGMPPLAAQHCSGLGIRVHRAKAVRSCFYFPPAKRHTWQLSPIKEGTVLSTFVHASRSSNQSRGRQPL